MRLLYKYQTGGTVASKPATTPVQTLPPVSVKPSTPVQKSKKLTLEQAMSLPAEDFLKLDPADQLAYKTQNYKAWKSQSYRNTDIYTKKLAGNDLQAWINNKKTTDPHAFVHTGEPTEVWLSQNADNFFPQYQDPRLAKPAAIPPTTPVVTTPPAPKPETQPAQYYVNPHTYEPLSTAEYGTPPADWQGERRGAGAVLNQGATMSALKYENSPEGKAKAAAVNEMREKQAAQAAVYQQLSPEQQASWRKYQQFARSKNIQAAPIEEWMQQQGITAPKQNIAPDSTNTVPIRKKGGLLYKTLI